MNGGSLTSRTRFAAAEVLGGRRRGLRSLLPFAGPAIIASVAYMDPGNYATNIQGGARYGYALLWVVVLANLMAMLFQTLSARLGIVTGRNLAELCRQHFPRPLVIFMWLGSEVAAMATDLAEFIGAAVGLSILLQVPLMAGMGGTAVATYAVLTLERAGFRPVELAIAGFVAVIGASYLIELAIAPPDWRAVAVHSLLPSLPDADAVLLAVGIVGATVMPHAIYLHSGLTQDRVIARGEVERRRLLRFSDIEVVVALGFAGLVNMAMLAMSAAVFHDGTHNGTAEIEAAYQILGPLLGGGAAAVFMVSLLASGLSSSAVGTMAGQVIMQGFVGFRIPLWLRRLVTMAPSFVVIALGVNPTQALVVSQVVLSLLLPLPMVALLVLVRRADVMGAFRPGAVLFAISVGAGVAILVLNAVLILQTFGVPLPLVG